MAKIRQYGPRVNPVDAGVGRVNVVPAAFGEAESRANEAVGRAISGVGETMYRIAERQEVLDVEEKMSELQNQIGQGFKQSYNTADPKDKEFGERFIKKSKEQLDSLRGEFSTKQGRLAYERMRSSIYSSVQEKATSAQMDLSGQAAVQSYESILSNKSSYLVSNPGEFKAELKRVDEAMAAVEQTGAFGGAKLDGEKRNARALMAESAVRGWIDVDPVLAQKKLKSGEYDEYFSDGKQKASLLRAAESRAKTNSDFDKDMSEAQRSQLINDQYKFARRPEVNIPYENIQFDSRDSWKQRENFRNDFEQRTGIRPPLLDKLEEKRVMDGFDSSNLDVVVQDLQTYKSSMTKEQYNSFSKQIFKKRPEYGVALAVSVDDEETAKQIIQGSRIKKTENFQFGSGVPALMKSEFNEIIGDSLGGNPQETQFKDTNYQAVESLIAQKINSGQISGDPSKSDIKDAFTQILGPTFKVNDKKVLTFKAKDKQWVDQDYFTEIIEEATIDDISKVGGTPMIGKSPLTKNLLEDATFIPRANGQYHLKVNGRIVMDEKNKPYILNMKALEESGKYERPGFFDRVFQ